MPSGRGYPYQRLLRISLRTLHIASAVLVLGAIHFGHAQTAWKWALLLSGLGILADDFYRYGLEWLRWLQFWAALVKLGLVGLGLASAAAMEPGHWAALVIGSFISHAPGRFRHHALWGPQSSL